MITRALLVLLLAPTAAAAETYFLAVDVPAELGGTDYAAHEIVLSDGAAYSLELALPAGTDLSAIALQPDGLWLFSPSHPVTLDGADYEPRDVVSTDGATYGLELDGSAAGIAQGARIDALFRPAAGQLVLSFDVPVALDGDEYGRSDLVLHDGNAFSSYWDAAAAGVPAYANLVGAAEDGSGTLALTFDVPVELGGVDYWPGELVDWDGSSFNTRHADAGWPPYAQLRDFSFAPPSGAVGMLTVGKDAGGDLVLDWGASCNTDDGDYGVYEGRMGVFDSHLPKLCSSGGATGITITPEDWSTYYLVVPQNARREGSYGLDGATAERVVSENACLPQTIGVCH